MTVSKITRRRMSASQRARRVREDAQRKADASAAESRLAKAITIAQAHAAKADSAVAFAIDELIQRAQSGTRSG
jgi:hypothetical protein